MKASDLNIPAPYREVVELWIPGDMSYREIADAVKGMAKRKGQGDYNEAGVRSIIQKHMRDFFPELAGLLDDAYYSELRILCEAHLKTVRRSDYALRRVASEVARHPSWVTGLHRNLGMRGTARAAASFGKALFHDTKVAVTKRGSLSKTDLKYARVFQGFQAQIIAHSHDHRQAYRYLQPVIAARSIAASTHFDPVTESWHFALGEFPGNAEALHSTVLLNQFAKTLFVMGDMAAAIQQSQLATAVCFQGINGNDGPTREAFRLGVVRSLAQEQEVWCYAGRPTKCHAIHEQVMTQARILEEESSRNGTDHSGLSKSWRALSWCDFSNAMRERDHDAMLRQFDSAHASMMLSYEAAARIVPPDPQHDLLRYLRDGPGSLGGSARSLVALNGLVDINLLRGNYSEARRFRLQADAEAQRLQGSRHAWALPPLVPFFKWTQDGASDDDVEMWYANLRLARGVGDSAFEPLMHISLGDLLRARGNAASLRAARSQYHKALDPPPPYFGPDLADTSGAMISRFPLRTKFFKQGLFAAVAESRIEDCERSLAPENGRLPPARQLGPTPVTAPSALPKASSP